MKEHTRSRTGPPAPTGARPSGDGWGCPHDDRGTCQKRGRPCEPGEGGCVLAGKIVLGP